MNTATSTTRRRETMTTVKINNKYFKMNGTTYKTKNGDYFTVDKQSEYIVKKETEKAVLISVKYVRATPSTNEKAINDFLVEKWVPKSLLD